MYLTQTAVVFVLMYHAIVLAVSMGLMSHAHDSGVTCAFVGIVTFDHH